VACSATLDSRLSGFSKPLKLLHDCCADLEERVAELEATTARKGNRKVSLTVYGHVNEQVLYWDDGAMSDVYQVTNDESRTRFGFRGSAKIDSDWSAGYRIEIGIRTANSGAVSQFAGAFDEDDQGNPDPNFNPGDDLGGGALDLRHAFWWIESKSLGRLSVGQTDTPTSSTFTLTLANIVALSGDPTTQGAGMLLRATDGSLLDVSWGDLMHPEQGSLSRRNEVMYTTPEFAGFQASAAWGEADFWAVSLAYAGEFSGFRLAAKVAYADMSDAGTFGFCEGVGGDPLNHTEADCNHWTAAASVLHVPTGLFLSGGYVSFTDNNRAVTLDDNDEAWWVHGGIEQKYFALGKTTLYGEYGEQENGETGFDGTTMSFWGLGLTQSIDAAAMDLYLFYRNYSAEEQIGGFDIEDLTLVGAGAIIRF
jgi:predicted porin